MITIHKTTIMVAVGQERRALDIADDFLVNHSRNHRTTNAKRNGLPFRFDDRNGTKWFLAYGNPQHIRVEQRLKEGAVNG